MTKIKQAFDNLINTIAEETLIKFKKLEATADARRLARLEQDLIALDKKNNIAPNEV